MKIREIVGYLENIKESLNAAESSELAEILDKDTYEKFESVLNKAQNKLLDCKDLKKENKKLRKENESLQEKIAELESENKSLKHREEHEYEEEFAGPAMG